jgi:hypothetical protein
MAQQEKELPSELAAFPDIPWTLKSVNEFYTTYEAKLNNYDVTLIVTYCKGEVNMVQSHNIFPRFLERNFRTVADMVKWWTQ